MLKLASLFDGISGFPLAGTRHGIRPIWASEIEKFPSMVSSIRFPGMVQHGDVTKINGADVEPVDIITFGSPCQDLSLAGKRAGMQHTDKGDEQTTRSGLFMEAVRIIKEMRDATGTNDDVQPRFAVWENVPGAYSSNEGEDFKTVLEELCKVADPEVSIPRSKGWKPSGCIMGDGFSIAWRTVDAQHWGVPQRRRRIFLVADFGGCTAPEILFKREGLRRDIAESREARERTAEDAERCIDSSTKCLTPWDCQSKKIFDVSGKYPTLQAMGDGGANNTAIFYCLQGNGIDRADTAGCNGKGRRENASYTLNTIDRHAVMIENHPADSRVKIDDSGTCQTLTTRMGTGGGNVPMAMTGFRMTAFGEYADDDTASAMKARDYKDATDLAVNNMRVRRLTPLECERLQGFPDGWTDIEKASDRARYKALGNSVAIPCVEYVMQGIAMV